MRHYAWYTLLLLPSLMMAVEGPTDPAGTEMIQDVAPAEEQQAMAIEPAGEQPAEPADPTTAKVTQKRKHRKHRKHCKAAKKSCKHHRKSVHPATGQIKDLWNVRYNSNCAMPQVVTPVCAPSYAPAA